VRGWNCQGQASRLPYEMARAKNKPAAPPGMAANRGLFVNGNAGTHRQSESGMFNNRAGSV